MIIREIQKNDIYLLSEYKSFFSNNNETIPGAAGLETCKDVSTWINEKLLEKSKKTILNKNFVPATTFLLIDNNTLIGIINIRHELNDYLLNFGGHIGYSIRSDYRRRGFAKLLLNHVINYTFNKLNLDKILITCDSTNIASEKTILSCGGVLDNIIVSNANKLTKRFWINKKRIN
ncbi:MULTISPECIES: GNAT family N-acetyltransferase [unclassified Gemella]|uniref:GNAT family N-acetyltransferase n=1 Tax=unclassified Gemella TaxID=2624949 RepID=UPI0010730510|nr:MULTISPECIES: GNAT family N-acetyltransferase [unclassified Gemella]MBF0709619.1 GNAT family N-acetyltransferase [Gemella sp. GL1.1]MBF0746962.1 GNAT family N-acetyltransferase [Gemella sp. 19428wG2_WT2a]NYS26963.1 GNAT family N-acetyltransferase [Gemella sp. GL1]TFU59187.1 GNAT family N-acetyltransferase [Gemella sp. WT2a]